MSQNEDRSHALPIYEVEASLKDALATHGRALITAPTGSGKSTQVPQIVLETLQESSGRIYVLQPRRIATRMLAQRVAAERKSKLGAEVGYQIRFDDRTSSETRICFLTEALFLGKILSNPTLADASAVIFDEFHERQLASDLSLALILRAVRSERPDLKLIVMSATIERDRLLDYLAPCAQITSKGRTFPVTHEYAGASLGHSVSEVWERAAKAFRKQVRAGTSGHTLIFMPGAFEIRKTIESLGKLSCSRDFDIVPLHGDLGPDAQDRAVQPSEKQRVIVSTNVAETSLTINDVQTVIDSGLARISRYDVNRGIDTILVEPISQASADQRAGRAGRTSAGHCIRLWSEAEHSARAPQQTPEIHRVDLASTLLQLAASRYPVDETGACLDWLEEPDPQRWAIALDHLRSLSAIDANNRITELGQAMSAYPLHPRFARMLIESSPLGVLETVCRFVALAQGRSVYRVARDPDVRREQIKRIEDPAGDDSDHLVQISAVEFAMSARFDLGQCRSLGIHAGASRQAQAVFEQLLALAKRAGLDVRSPHLPDEKERFTKCLLAAFSDKIGKRIDRGTRRCRLMNGKTAELCRESRVTSEYFIATEIEERTTRSGVSTLIRMATGLPFELIEETFPQSIRSERSTTYNTQTRRVETCDVRAFRSLILKEKPSTEVDQNIAAELLAKEVVGGRLKLKRWDSEVERWIQRVNFVAKHCAETEILFIDEEAQKLLVEQICEGAVSYKEIKDRPVLPVVKSWLAPEQLYYLDSYAPEEIALPGRKRPARIRYEADGRAVLSSKLQDFYGVANRDLLIANSQVPLVVELLAPNQRPVHVTDDLDGFWKGAYLHVKKDLAGRYPKHEWR